MSEVTLFGRPGCHLCDDARVALELLREQLPFTLVERDITEDESLHRAYFERIPVISLDGREVCDFFVDSELLRRELAAAVPQPPRVANPTGDHLESGR